MVDDQVDVPFTAAGVVNAKRELWLGPDENSA
jgi:hypothetical protein